jgi:hypothetical protein
MLSLLSLAGSHPLPSLPFPSLPFSYYLPYRLLIVCEGLCEVQLSEARVTIEARLKEASWSSLMEHFDAEPFKSLQADNRAFLEFGIFERGDVVVLFSDCVLVAVGGANKRDHGKLFISRQAKDPSLSSTQKYPPCVC